jgi:hypothetical protein
MDAQFLCKYLLLTFISELSNKLVRVHGIRTTRVGREWRITAKHMNTFICKDFLPLLSAAHVALFDRSGDASIS